MEKNVVFIIASGRQVINNIKAQFWSAFDTIEYLATLNWSIRMIHEAQCGYNVQLVIRITRNKEVESTFQFTKEISLPLEIRLQTHAIVSYKNL